MNKFQGTQVELDLIATYPIVMFTYPGHINTYTDREGAKAIIRRCIQRRCKFLWEGLTQKEFDERMKPS